MGRPTTRRARVLLATLVLPAVWSLTVTSRADAAATLVEVGWWTRSPLASAPDGGFTVGAAPDGATSVAAVRVDLGEDVGTLVVDATPSGDASALASLEVCVTGDGWSAASGDALESAPATECAGDAVPFAEAGGSWRADVSSLVSGLDGTVSLAIVPTAGSGTIPFEVGFEAPTALGGGGSAPAPTTAPPAPAPSPSPTPAPAPAPRTAGPSLSPAPFAPPATRPAAAPTTTAPATTAPPTTVATEAGSAFELADGGVLEASASGRGARWGEAFVLVLIGAAVGLGVFTTSRIAAARA